MQQSLPVIYSTVQGLLFALAFIFQIYVASYVIGLNYAWKYGTNLQELCGNNAMEIETTRYNVYAYEKAHASRTRTVATSMFSAVCGLLLVVLVLALAGVSANVSWPVVSVLTVLLCIPPYVRLLSLVRNKVSPSEYEKSLTSVAEILPKIMAEATKDATKSTVYADMLSYMANNILVYEQQPSIEAARDRLDDLLKNTTTNTGDDKAKAETEAMAKAEVAVRYIRFHAYGSDKKSLQTASAGEKAAGALEAIKKLQSFAYGAPSLKSIMWEWSLQMYFLLAVMSYFGVFHVTYKRMGFSAVATAALVTFVLYVVGYAWMSWTLSY